MQKAVRKHELGERDLTKKPESNIVIGDSCKEQSLNSHTVKTCSHNNLLHGFLARDTVLISATSFPITCFFSKFFLWVTAGQKTTIKEKKKYSRKNSEKCPK